MPIYEFLCRSCRKKVEVLVRNRTQKALCPECGSARLSRQFSTFAAHQGSGAGDTPCKSGRCPGAIRSACAAGNCPLAS